MPGRKRPPLYWKSLLIGGPGLLVLSVALVVDGRQVLAVALVIVAIAVFLGPWLLSPYSRAARSIASPSDAALDRTERLADWLGSVPIFGTIWRGAERLTGNAGRQATEEYRRWRHEHDDDAT